PLLPPPPSCTLFPYTTLFRSRRREIAQVVPHLRGERVQLGGLAHRRQRFLQPPQAGEEKAVSAPHLRIAAAQPQGGLEVRLRAPDRKSTRLNSSHQIISYAVF